mgnify:CR=1 FL=1
MIGKGVIGVEEETAWSGPTWLMFHDESNPGLKLTLAPLIQTMPESV